jgi:Ser-tRNA(Ala) deacylase AlaX
LAAWPVEALTWSRQRELNPHLSLRRTPFYPLNYGEPGTRGIVGAGSQAQGAVRAIDAQAEIPWKEVSLSARPELR